ncbi:MAG: hypothetical protein WKG03_14575, partial [Telluria sp.]
MLRAFEPQAGFTNLSDWHFADMAPALGGIGCRVSTRAELGAALDAALARRGVRHARALRAGRASPANCHPLRSRPMTVAPMIPELVCPAGSLPALKAAVDNGADCVYLGFRDATNARNFAGLKFDDETIRM